MRRDSNRRENQRQSFENRILISGGLVLLLIVGLIIGISIYSDSLNNNAKQSQFSSDQIASLVPNEEENTMTAESASSSIGKTVEESENTTNNTTNSSATKKKSNSSTTTNSNKTTSTTKNVAPTNATVKETEKKEVTFTKPVEGDIIKEFAKDNLIYSETLKEWVTHLGIDIKANKTTVVKSAADGTIKSIKNDPRYGLTIIIEHDDGYQTIYSNLLTTEFVVEGEKVTQGQSIGTVGSTAVFEISDESHLHFELLKDSEYLDPSIYIK